MKKIGEFKTLPALLVLMTGLLSPVYASTLVPLGVGELIPLSREVVTGKVLMTRTEMDSTDRIVTHVTIAVERYFKSDSPLSAAPPFITVVVHSGTKGALRTVLVSGPVFEEGQRVVVFLHPDDEGNLQVVGLNQGLFSIADRSGRQTDVIGRLGKPDNEWDRMTGGRVRMDYERFNTRLGAMIQLEEFRRFEAEQSR